MPGTVTSSFGMGKREAHDSSAFYERRLFGDGSGAAPGFYDRGLYRSLFRPLTGADVAAPGGEAPGGWRDTVCCASSERMAAIPDGSVALAFTSPPYNAGKDYDDDLDLPAYLEQIRRVGQEVSRVLMPGGRYIINVANLGRKPYVPMHAYFYDVHLDIGFLPMGEIIWQKSRGSNGSCAWGSWMSAAAPRLRDLHEYLLVFSRGAFSRPDKGISDISRDEFMEATLSVWNIPPESARRVGHPAPFPVALAERVIRLYSYVGDVVLDPFMGSGTTCVAAARNGRHFVGYDTEQRYCDLARARIAADVEARGEAVQRALL